jgi:hypothetical protein
VYYQVTSECGARDAGNSVWLDLLEQAEPNRIRNNAHLHRVLYVACGLFLGHPVRVRGVQRLVVATSVVVESIVAVDNQKAALTSDLREAEQTYAVDPEEVPR